MASPGGNVLLITVDQWRGDCLSALDHPVVETPALDRLAATGTLFANHWANAAPCGPSRACLYTGTYSTTNRAVLNGTPLDARLTNVALEARAAGYDPVQFGYTDSSVDPRGVAPDDPRLLSYEGVLPGMRAVVDLPSATMAPWIDWLVAEGYERPARPDDLFGPDLDHPGAADHHPTWAPPVYDAAHSETAFLTDQALAWLEGADRPWFVHLSYLRPHPPYRVVAPYHDRYDPATVPAPVRAATRQLEGIHPLVATATRIPGVGAPDDDAEMRQIKATYYGMMAEVDDHLGRVFDWLDATGAADKTLVVLTSDHGDQMGDHWLLEKLGWFDESYHVPLIVRDPRAPAEARGQRIEAFTEHVDVMPTVLEWLSADVPAQCDGRSLHPFVTGTASAELVAGWRGEAHFQWDFSDPAHHLAEDAFGLTSEQCNLDVIRDHRWKYVHMAGLPPLLFDLASDPAQLVDRSTDPTCAPVVAEYAQRLLSWRMRHADRTLSTVMITGHGAIQRVDPRIG